MGLDHCVHFILDYAPNSCDKKLTKTIQNGKKMGVYKIILKLGGKVERANLIFSNPIHAPRE